MSGFTIDDVRETFTADMNNLLGRAERAARDVSASPLFDEAAWSSEPPKLQALSDTCHAIAGTSGLVSAASLHQSAKLLEAMCEEGVELLAQAAAATARARRLANICADGVASMRGMLELELDRQGDEALARSTVFQARASKRRDAAPESASEAATATAFAFDEPDEHPDLAEELSIVFRDEATSLGTALATHLAALRSAPTDREALAQVERVLHTLKGAAATVGMLGFRDAAAALQDRAEAAIERGEPADAALVCEIRDEANAMLREAGIPELPDVASLPPPTLAKTTYDIAARPARAESFSFEGTSSDSSLHLGDELGAIFQQEAAEAMTALDGHLRSLAARPEDTQSLSAVERIFHTIKGAAATVGNAAASQLAASLQHHTEELLANDTAADARVIAGLQADIDRLRGLAGLPAAVVAPREASLHASDSMAATRDAFAGEARETCAEIRALALQIPIAGAREAEVRAEMARLIHRLKGSALVSGAPAIATVAARAQGIREASAILEAITEIERSLAGPRARSRKPQRESVTIPAERELWDAFSQECADLLERLDRAILDLESTSRPDAVIDTLGGLFHSLKGAVNTVGLAPTGKVLHLIEDLFDGLASKRITAPPRGIVGILLEAMGEVRSNLAQAKQGWVETTPAYFEARIAKLVAGDAGASDSVSGVSREAPQASEASRGRGAAPVERFFIRVATERLDTLMNLAGELVVARSRLMTRVDTLRGLQRELGMSRKRLVDTIDRFRADNEFSALGSAAGVPEAPAPKPAAVDVAGFSELELDRYDDVNILARSLAELTDDVSETDTQLVRQLVAFGDDADAFGSIVSGIQSEVTRARMVPLDVVFARLLLPVRDAAEREGKEVRVITRGEDVSLDKAIADALVTPLLHLVRNAVAHGIEPAAQRTRAGKAPEGVISLGAREESGQIVLEVRDDGGGLDLPALRARGAALGLVAPDIALTDPKVAELVFAPKLSTLAVAGAVAGRGIGGDVVRRTIERLNGRIHVHSEPGRGTTFSVTLPLTLTITKALVIRHRRRFFAVPLHFAERILDADEAVILESAGVRRVKVDQSYLAIHTLDAILDLERDAAPRGPILVLRVGDQRTTVQVESLLGQEEIVVKSLGHLLTGHPMFAGITLRGTGDLALILDAPAIIEASGHKAPREGTDAPTTTNVVEEASPVSEPAPRARSVSEPIEPTRPLTPPAKGKTRVLFVDDSLSVRKVAEKALESIGAEVTLAVDGVDALAKMRERAFDVVFTDLEMPRMHGYDLIRELRFVPAYAKIPVLVVSSRSTQKHQDQAHALGASDYLTKPFTAHTLEAALARWVPGRGGRPPT